MAEEFDTLPEVPQDSPGEGEDSGTPAAETPKLDLTQTQEWRNAQSAYDRQIAAERQARQIAEQEARRLADEKASLEEVLNSELDPEKAEIARARIIQSAQEAQLREYQRRDWENYWNNAAREAGLDPAGEDFQRALWEAKQANSNAPLQVKIEVAKQVAAVKASIAPASPAPAQEETMPSNQPPRPGSDGYVMPPAGKVMAKGGSRIEQINAELIGLVKDYSKNLPRIQQLRAERDKLEQAG